MLKALQIPYDETFEMRIKCIAAAGFDAVSVNLEPASRLSDREWEEAAERINTLLDAYSLKCVQTHLPMYDMMLSAEIPSANTEKALKYAIKTTGEIGAPWGAYHPRTAFNYGCSSKMAEEFNRRDISRYIEWADKANCGIAIENLPVFHEITPVKPFYTHDYYDLVSLCDALDSDRVGICWDTGHANLMDFDQVKAIEYMAERIKCTHIHNNFCRSDDHLTPDMGNIDWKAVMGAMASAGYTGPLTLETNCRYMDEGIYMSFARHNLVCLDYMEEMYVEAL